MILCGKKEFEILSIAISNNQNVILIFLNNTLFTVCGICKYKFYTIKIIYNNLIK